MKSRGTQGLSLARYSQIWLGIPKDPRNYTRLSCFHRSGKKGKSFCGMKNEVEIPEQFKILYL